MKDIAMALLMALMVAVSIPLGIAYLGVFAAILMAVFIVGAVALLVVVTWVTICGWFER